MDPAAATCARLIGALEDLSDREAGAIAAADPMALEDIQGRVAPLVSYLCEHAAEFIEPGLRRRLTAVVARREHTLAHLGRELERMRVRLDALRSHQRRIAAVAPVYGRPSVSSGRLSVVG